MGRFHVVGVAVLAGLAVGIDFGVKQISLFPPNKVPGVLPPMGPEDCSQMQTGVVNTTTCTNVSVPALVPFLVPHADAAVVISPGGGFHGLAYSTEGTDIAKWLNSHGVSAFVLKYRVPAAFGYNEVPMMDAQRAVRLLRSRASQFGLNSSRIGFMGFSAGGDLAAGISASFAASAYDRIDDVDDVSCRPDFTLMVYPAVHGWAENITSDHPPSFFAQAENDPVSSELTTQYYLRLRNTSKAPSDLHIFHGAIHGYGLCNVRDAVGNIAVLMAPPDGPGLVPGFVPWSSVCLWPHMAKAFLHDLGLNESEHPHETIVV
jgi:acetyl esterase/lipase